MKSVTNSTFKKNTWSFIALFVAGLIAGIAVASLITHRSHTVNVSNDSDIIRLTNQSDSLESDFVKLQQLNEKYASVLTDKNLDSSQLNLLDSLNILITENETEFLKRLDSLQINNSYYNAHSSALYSRIIAAYRLNVDQNNAQSAVRNSLNIGNTNYNVDQNTLSNMQNVLQSKEAQVIVLTSQLYASKNNKVNDVPADFKTILKQQDSVLTTVLQSQKNRNQDLTMYANKLKKDNDRLTNEITMLQNDNIQKAPAATTPVVTASTTDINEQVNLVKADCYLSKADANQIISNARQRRDFLQSALQILNRLSQSSNTAVKQEAQQKLQELKTIAANNHD